MNRRKFVATVCGLALSADAAPLLAATSKKSKTATLLGKLKTASFHKKIELSEITRRWWSEWTYGMDENFLGYYWFAVDLVHDTWRPLSRTKLLPKEQWLFGDPFTSYLSQVRWNEPLCRFMIASVIAAQHNSDPKIESVARRMVGSLDPMHLHWIVDWDGKQLLPELSYYGQCLSSEAPGSFLAAYWKGRKDRLMYDAPGYAT